MLRVLIGRRRLMAVVVGGLLALGVAVVLLLPARYTATAAVLVDLNQTDPLAAMNGTQPGANAASVTGALSTQIDLLTSSRVLLRALQALRTNGDALADQRELWLKATQGLGDYDAWWVERLREDLVVKPTRESGVITLSVSAEDAAGAARAARAVMQAYLDTVLELRVEPARQYSRFFEERATALRQKLADAQAQLADYQRRQGVLGTGERLDMENLRLLELSSQLTALQGASVDSSEREAQAQRQAGRGADRMREVSTHPVIVGLQGQLSQQQARFGELSARLGENHPQVIESQAAVAQLRSRIESESARVAAGLGLASRVDEGRVAQLRLAVQAQRERVLRLKSGTDAAAVLEREVQAAQRAYDAVLAQGARAQLESQAHQANVTVLQQPTAPARPSSPKVGTILAVVTLFALLLAVGAALLAEQRDARVRATEDIRETLRLPVLVSLPTPSAAARTSPPARARGWPMPPSLPGAKA